MSDKEYVPHFTKDDIARLLRDADKRPAVPHVIRFHKCIMRCDYLPEARTGISKHFVMEGPSGYLRLPVAGNKYSDVLMLWAAFVKMSANRKGAEHWDKSELRKMSLKSPPWED